VLDANGNFILRLGRYGNADEPPNGRNPEKPEPGTRNPEPGKDKTREEVSRDTDSGIRATGSGDIPVACCAFVGVNDRRLVLSDSGNRRLVSVLLRPPGGAGDQAVRPQGKSEIRNSKSETSPKSKTARETAKIRCAKSCCFVLCFVAFLFVSDFGFRVSDLCRGRLVVLEDAPRAGGFLSCGLANS
jgi:hypothetical protein